MTYKVISNLIKTSNVFFYIYCGMANEDPLIFRWSRGFICSLSSYLLWNWKFAMIIHDLNHCHKLAWSRADKSMPLAVLVIITVLNSSLARYLYTYSILEMQLEALWKQEHHHAPWTMALLTTFPIRVISLVWENNCKRHAVAVELYKMSIHICISWKQLRSERHPLSQVHKRQHSIDYYGI